ncbi:MAG: hypothetical protein AAF940_09570 [Pseudomonadota bacterium]
MAPKRYALDRRFSAALSDKAYKQLRALNARFHLSNNYLLTVLLENLDQIADADELAAAFEAFIEEYGAPSGAMAKKQPTGQ